MAVKKPLRLRVLARATTYVGVREKPPGSNRGTLIDAWNQLANVPAGSPYCDAFVHAMHHAEGYELGSPKADDAYCPATLAMCQRNGWEVKRPYRGDLVFYDWNSDGVADHVGVIDRVLALRWRGGRFVGLLRAVEANTSSGLSGSQSDGDGVYRRTRWVNASTRFVRVPG